MEDKELQYLTDRIAMLVKCLAQKKPRRELIKYLESILGDLPNE